MTNFIKLKDLIFDAAKVKLVEIRERKHKETPYGLVVHFTDDTGVNLWCDSEKARQAAIDLIMESSKLKEDIKEE